MFITSRESAINVSMRVRVYFGVLSISQPEARAAQPESPGFLGFYGGFLEFTKTGLAVFVYRQRRYLLIPLYAVVSRSEARAAQPESPGFLGFYGGFLEFTKTGLAVFVYRQRRYLLIPLYAVVS